MYKLIVLVSVLLLACHSSSNEEMEASSAVVQTPVTVSHISFEPLQNDIELNATAVYRQSNIISASANGYIRYVGIQQGGFIKSGQLAFTMQTKEAAALGNTINGLDSSFHFSGMIRITAHHAGYVSQLDHQTGDYVQEGEQLAVLNDAGSFGFLLNLPYTYRSLLTINKNPEVILPDGTHLKGTMSNILPAVDSVSQTLPVMIRITNGVAIPANLIAKVRLVQALKSSVPSVPREAVLTDESQEHFWIMKMDGPNTAIKIPIIKGMETEDRVEIVSPQMKATDTIIIKGNYGLADTANVKIVKE